MNTLFSLRSAHLSKHGPRVILAMALLAFSLAFGTLSFASTAHAASSNAAVPKVALACPATIEEGSTGSSVRTLQAELNTLYQDYSDPRWFTDSPDAYSNPLAVDGDFGPQTRDAVIDYQFWNGLSVDGIVGPQTWHSLGHC